MPEVDISSEANLMPKEDFSFEPRATSFCDFLLCAEMTVAWAINNRPALMYIQLSDRRVFCSTCVCKCSKFFAHKEDAERWGLPCDIIHKSFDGAVM